METLTILDAKNLKLAYSKLNKNKFFLNLKKILQFIQFGMTMTME